MIWLAYPESKSPIRLDKVSSITFYWGTFGWNLGSSSLSTEDGMATLRSLFLVAGKFCFLFTTSLIGLGSTRGITSVASITSCFCTVAGYFTFYYGGSGFYFFGYSCLGITCVGPKRKSWSFFLLVLNFSTTSSSSSINTSRSTFFLFGNAGATNPLTGF